VSGLVALALCVATYSHIHAFTQVVAQAGDAAGFKEFADAVQVYLKLQRTVEATLPALKATDLPELIAAHQQALARKIREARPLAKPGDLLTPAACEAFRHASHGALVEGPHAADSREFMNQDAPDPNMRLVVNGVYPDTETITVLSPVLLAAFPPLPAEVAYRVVGRTLIVIDLKARLVVDIARLILPPTL
jgi:hypothetical protein